MTEILNGYLTTYLETGDILLLRFGAWELDMFLDGHS